MSLKQIAVWHCNVRYSIALLYPKFDTLSGVQHLAKFPLPSRPVNMRKPEIPLVVKPLKRFLGPGPCP